jgi:hypothetical protein
MDGIGGTTYTLEDLSDYLDSGREPVNPAIEASAECQAVLASLERVGSLSRDLVARDADENPALDENWFGSLFAAITLEVKAGKDIPLSSSDPHTHLSITEGAIRELVRVAGDSVDGVMVGKVGLSDAEVDISISVLLGIPVTAAAEAVRQAVYSDLLKHTELRVQAVNVTVEDVHVIAAAPEGDLS